MDKELQFEELEAMEEMVSDDFVKGFIAGLGAVGTVAGIIVAAST